MNKFIGMLAVGAALTVASASRAATIDWVQWNTSTFTTGQTGGQATATGVNANVTYTGEVNSVIANYPSWTPTGTYVGGNVGNAPPQSGGIVKLIGGQGTGANTITFSSPVVDPVIALWSLGQGGVPVSFNFDTSNLEVVAGGPSAEYQGSSITANGNVVSGVEGNGAVQFHGTFSEISWTNPNSENWYGFTVGSTAATPEPATWALMMVGVGGMGAALRTRRRKVAA